MDPTTTVDPRCVLTAERAYPVPPARLFEAIADPQQLARWWGPEGFRNVFDRFEFRPGGAWEFVMHGPDGATYRNVCEFAELERPGRVVLIHLRPMHRFTLTLTFEAQGEGSLLRWHMRFDTAAEVEPLRAVLDAANAQNLERLAAVVAAS